MMDWGYFSLFLVLSGSCFHSFKKVESVFSLWFNLGGSTSSVIPVQMMVDMIHFGL